MIVRYVDAIGGDHIARHGISTLNLNQDYAVLEIYAQPGRETYFRIEQVPGEPPGLYDIRLFRIIASRIPPTWCVGMTEGGYLTFGPAVWQVPDFWEAYLNREEWARVAFETERKKILASAE